MSFTSNVAYSSNVTLAECLALKKAMTLRAGVGFEQTLFEGDCQKIVQVVNLGKGCSIGLRPILFDIQELLITHSSWIVIFTHKIANKPAHYLAKEACKL